MSSAFDPNHWAAGVRVAFSDGEGVVEAVDATTGESRVKLADGTVVLGSEVVDISWGDE